VDGVDKYGSVVGKFITSGRAGRCKKCESGVAPIRCPVLENSAGKRKLVDELPVAENKRIIRKFGTIGKTRTFLKKYQQNGEDSMGAGNFMC
jgi:hypothetical protein